MPQSPSNPAIESRADVMFGKAVIAGTRITVESLVDRLAAGESPEQILRAHPKLTPGALRAAWAYVSSVMKSDITHPMAG